MRGEPLRRRRRRAEAGGVFVFASFKGPRPTARAAGCASGDIAGAAKTKIVTEGASDSSRLQNRRAGEIIWPRVAQRALPPDNTPGGRAGLSGGLLQEAFAPGGRGKYLGFTISRAGERRDQAGLGRRGEFYSAGVARGGAKKKNGRRDRGHHFSHLISTGPARGRGNGAPRGGGPGG